MKPYPWKAGVLLALAALLVTFLALSPGCGGDDNPGAPNGDVPEQWVGLWEETVTLTDCETQQQVDITDTLTICPNAEDYGDDGGGFNCEYTWDGNQMSITCTYVDSTFAPCFGTHTLHWHAQVTGTSFTAEGGDVGVYSGTECPFDTSCVEIGMTGQRIGDAPEPCNPGDGGGTGGELAGLSVQVSGGETNFTFDPSDLITLVTYDTTAHKYLIVAGLTQGGSTAQLYMAFPREGDPFEFVTDPTIEGKAYVQFTMVIGTSEFVLQNVTGGELALSEATEDKIVGTFHLSGEVAEPLGDPVLFQFQNGEFELSVDAKTSGAGKGAVSSPSQARILSKIQRDIFRAMREGGR